MQWPPQNANRVFVDATYTINSGRNSGIERVVRKLIQGTREVAKQANFAVPELIVNCGGRFYVADEQYMAAAARLSARHENILASTSPAYRWIANGLCRLSKSRRLKKWMLPQSGHLGAFKLAHSLELAAARRKLTHRVGALAAEAGDLILLPDAYWVQRLGNSTWPAAASARAQGAFVGTVLYDLIPLTHPEFVGKKRCDGFLNYLTNAAQNSDVLLTISETVREQVREFLPAIAADGDGYCQRIVSFQLGAELGDCQSEDMRAGSGPGKIRQHVVEFFERGATPYLTVAAFDPRKNHTYLLDAFDELWRRGEDVRLCLVGRIGASCNELIQRILLHPELEKRLRLFEDLSDTELHYCYRHSRAVVFPSIVEGYGLPIVESLWFGKKTFVSDTKIHREVGQTDCSYFDLSDHHHLVKQLTDWEITVRCGVAPQLPTRTPTGWLESSHQVLDACFQAMQTTPSEEKTKAA